MATKKKTATRKRTTKKKQGPVEQDSVFFLKLTVFLILGSQWVYISSYPDWEIPIPIGLIIGLVFATHEHFQIDKKIEYAILLVTSFIAYWLPIGLLISL